MRAALLPPIAGLAVARAQTDVTSPRGTRAAVGRGRRPRVAATSPLTAAVVRRTLTVLCLAAGATPAPATTRNRHAV